MEVANILSPGVDDTMAIYFALNSPLIEVVGLTTIFGNVDVDLATVNAVQNIPCAFGSMIYP